MSTQQHEISFPHTRGMTCTCGGAGILCCMRCTWCMNEIPTSMLTAALYCEAAEGIMKVPGKVAVG